jgi:hypothetical protein
MFKRQVSVEFEDLARIVKVCPVGWIDNFAMRNFTNDAIFDDTLPIGDGRMEIGNRIPLERLQSSMEDWFRRKGYLKAGEMLKVVEQGAGE